MYERYLGPLVVVSRSQGGSYVLAELDGMIMGGKVAQFQVIPYLARRSIKLPENIHDFIDVSPATLENLLDSEEPVFEEDGEDYAFNGVKLKLTTKEDDDSTSDLKQEEANKNKLNESDEEADDINKGVDGSRTRRLRPRK